MIRLKKCNGVRLIRWKKCKDTRVRDKEKQEENMEKIGNLAGILYIYS